MRPADIPFKPCDVSKIKLIAPLQGAGHYQSEEYFDIGTFQDKYNFMPANPQLTQWYRMYNNYTGNVDLTGYRTDSRAQIANNMWVDSLILGNISNTGNIAQYLHISKPFDASAITTIENTVMDLGYTSASSPQNFPNLTSILM